tara:strand:+ start:398 stop:1108 length:711 start_codon:yes stop_codon:yes gene_type:complete
LKVFKKKNIIKKILNNSTLNFRLFEVIKILFFIQITFLIGCSSIKKNEDLDICSSVSLPCLSSKEYVLLITNKGSIKLELYGEFAPITVGNFIDYVEKGAYEKTRFNRVIKYPFLFIIRGGDYSSIKGENKFIDHKTGKVRYIPLEIKLESNKLPTYGKEIDISNPKNKIDLKHKRSYVSMARSKNINSASSQFYISLKSLPELDGRFAVFGKVISGMNVVNLIEENDFIVEAKRL